MANNPGGINQYGDTTYGDIKRRTELQRAAPMSGAPTATRATEAPRRAKRRAVRGSSPPAASVIEPMAAGGGPSPTPDAEVAAIWQTLASEEGASPLIRQYATQARV